MANSKHFHFEKTPNITKIAIHRQGTELNLLNHPIHIRIVFDYGEGFDVCSNIYIASINQKGLNATIEFPFTGNTADVTLTQMENNDIEHANAKPIP